MSRLFVILFTLISINTFAQDVITTKKGEEILCKVIKIGTTEIEYKKWSNIDGPSYTLQREMVFMIKYHNGEKEVFENSNDGQNINKPYNYEGVKDNYGSPSLYKFDDKQHLLDKATGARKAAKNTIWIVYPIALAVGVGGVFLFDEPNMVWAGLGVSVVGGIVSGCLTSKARRLERKASLYYGWNGDFKIGNTQFYASTGLLDNGNVGVVLNF